MSDRLSTDTPAPVASAQYTLAEAARVLGYKHLGTVRNKHYRGIDALTVEHVNGHAALRKDEVDTLARKLDAERRARDPQWRLENLGRYAQDLRPRRRRRQDADATT
ncbi:MAG TPA: hypothetical protein VIK25_09100 [Gemmatimonadaceae bacterium]